MVPIAEHWDAEKHWSQDATDAIRAMRDLVDVLEWYVVHYDPSCRLEETPAGRASVEILPQLRERCSRYLRPEIISVRFIQSQDRCYLEITTVDRLNDHLADETSKRTDLAFIGHGPGLFFDPGRSITDNTRRFISDFDGVR